MKNNWGPGQQPTPECVKEKADQLLKETILASEREERDREPARE